LERGVRGLRTRQCMSNLVRMDELVFEVTQEADSGFVAEALGENIFTQGDTWDALRANVREAVKAFYFERPALGGLRLHLVRGIGLRHDYDSPALEAALLEGARSPHRPYGRATLDRVRKAARGTN
jgi:hypothetical protein